MITLKEIQNSDVRALWVKQPYASAFLHGKQIETRTWHTKYRGLVLICSTASPYTLQQAQQIAGQHQHARLMHNMGQPKSYKDLPLSQAICIARLVDSRPMLPTDADEAFVNYHYRLYSHVYEHITPVQPMHMPGRLGLCLLGAETRMGIRF